jgi:hypothetical protein
MTMSFRRRLPATVLTTLVLGLAACGGPIVMLPGGELSGTLTAVPSDWSFTDSVETLQLETRPSDPYSVNIWGVGMGDRLYIACGDRENRWCSYISEDPNVRLRVNDSIYELRAELVESDSERDAFLAVLRKKYDREVTSEEQGRALAYALTARE